MGNNSMGSQGRQGPGPNSYGGMRGYPQQGGPQGGPQGQRRGPPGPGGY